VFSRDFRPAIRRRTDKTKIRTSAMDIVVLGIGVLFFALFFAYIKACDRL
jgi:hypothetical protein